jgi:hypothetical protein
MPSYEVKSRVTHAATVETIEALHREDAVHQVVTNVTATPGDEVDVLTVTELPGTSGGATGATGATGGAFDAFGTQAHAPEDRVTRAQLNEMTKDELLAAAEREGAEVNHNWNKGDIVDAIVKHRKHA